MLERFHVPDQEIILIKEENLRNVTEQIFMSQGMPEKDCKLATDVLISSDLRGVETHGVSNLSLIHISEPHETPEHLVCRLVL